MAQDEEIVQFDEPTDLARNIRKGSRWVDANGGIYIVFSKEFAWNPKRKMWDVCDKIHVLNFQTEEIEVVNYQDFRTSEAQGLIKRFQPTIVKQEIFA